MTGRLIDLGASTGIWFLGGGVIATLQNALKWSRRHSFGCFSKAQAQSYYGERGREREM